MKSEVGSRSRKKGKVEIACGLPGGKMTLYGTPGGRKEAFSGFSWEKKLP